MANKIEYRYEPELFTSPGETLLDTLLAKGLTQLDFAHRLTHIRKLTAKQFDLAKAEMIKHCATAGVSVVILPEVGRARVSGATRWLNPNKALIQISLRYKSDDHFWFTFFHEAGHIIKHGKKDLFIDEDGMHDVREEEANRFASELLIPQRELSLFIKSNPTPSEQDVNRFASRLGIAPSIVVGRLQHDRTIPFNYFKTLKQNLA